MFRNTLRISLAVALLAGLFDAASAQDDKQPPKAAPPVPREDYREFFRKPETVQDFWRAMRFEIEVGRFDLAARMLRGLLDKKPDDKDLLEIEEKEGIAGFLRLNNIRKWDDNPKANDQALKDVQELIERATTALKNHLGDPGRITKFVKNLNGEPEERAYALKELYRSGAVAVPYLIDELRKGDEAERNAILTALPKLGRDTVPPLLAALDIDDAELRWELIDVLQKRAATEAVPYLWYLSTSQKQPERVRQKATAALAFLTDTPAGKLPPAKLALTKEAERYFKHEVKFANPSAVPVWRWDGKRIVEGWPPRATTIPASKAEEYYGLRFAGQALDLDPTYQPAQLVFLSLALEKAVEQAGLEQASVLGTPGVSELIYTINPELVTTVLERALVERRLPVILGAVRALGDLGDVRSVRPTGHGTPALVRALNYPERRVQYAAAEALLRTPGVQNPPAPARVVEVLRRAVALDVTPKAPPRVLVGFFERDVADKVGETVTKIGLEPIKVATGRELLKRLNESADIDAILIDADLPDPLISPLLGQLRADVNAGLLPVLIFAPREREVGLRRMIEGYRNVWVVPAEMALDPDALQKTLLAAFNDSGMQPLADTERKRQAERAIGWLARLSSGVVPGYDVRPATETMLAALRSGKLGEEAMAAAIEAVSRLPGQPAQLELANVVLDAKKPGRTPLLRAIAAQELSRHIQQYGAALPANIVRALDELRQRETDAGVRASVGLVLGSLRPDARQTGERLRNYNPLPLPPEPPPKEPPPPPPEKEKEKEKDNP